MNIAYWEGIALDKSFRDTIKFFVITFIQTWTCYFAIIIFGLNPKGGLGIVFLVCGGMAPSLIGIIMMLATYSRDQKKKFFQRVYQVKRIGVGWWFFILLIYPVVHIVSVLINSLIGAGMPTMEGLQDAIQSPASILLVLFIGFFINGAFPEEFGWRGFALQPLLDRFGFVKTNLLFGTIWAVWHLPLFFMPSMGHYHMGFVGFWFYLAQTIGLSTIMSLVFIRTRQSILSALLLHMFANLASNMMFSYSQVYERINFSIIFVVGVVINVYMSMPKSMSKSMSKKDFSLRI